MNKQAPSVGRILVMVGFALSCFGLLLYLWLTFGGPIPLKPKGYRFDVSFSEAQQLVRESDVRISGVTVGRVKETEANKKSGTTVATIEIEEKYAPIPRDTRAVLRQKTLLGETYVELTPGTRNGPKVRDGGALPPGAVSPTVEIDELFRTFNPKQRRNFQLWQQEFALATAGRGRDISETIGNLAPFAEETRDLARLLNAQEAALRGVVRDTGIVFEALSERDGQLRSLIENSERTFAATGRRARELRETFIALPTFERESQVTLRRLTRFANTTRPLVNQLRPFARELSPTLKSLAGLSPDLRSLFRDLDGTITASKRGLPGLDTVLDQLRRTLPEFTPVAKQLGPGLDGLKPYTGELSGFLANSAAATQAYTVEEDGRHLHYLRTINPMNPENFAVYQRRIGSNRTDPYYIAAALNELPRGLGSFEMRHCGRATPVLAPDTVDPPVLDPAVEALVPRKVAQELQTLAFGPTPSFIPAPPCREATRYPFFTDAPPAAPTKYPRVAENYRLGGAPTGGPQAFSPRPPNAEPATPPHAKPEMPAQAAAAGR
jgi:phospholipid/cholesterol/gamma-HCH transport system substrate-binding protein